VKLISAIPILLSLGLDTFAVALGLGLSGISGRDRLRYGLVFATAEGGMTVAGLVGGYALAAALSGAASYLAAVLLLSVGIYMVWESARGAESAVEVTDGAGLSPALVVTALSVSLDELAVGFGLGLLHVPVALAVAYIAAQAFLLTWLGTALGSALAERVAERAELLSGLVLALVALYLLAGHL
jgi:putative Mn2+ efflux pump MntP